MLQTALHDSAKKARYVASFLRRGLVHTNLQLLYDCNFRCRICDFWKDEYKSRPRLSASQVEVISGKLAEIGPQIVSIGGGEPLMHPEIVEVVRALGRHHFPVMICNGWMVNPKVARSLWAAGMYEISVSVDYAEPAKHDLQRGIPGAYERAFAALKTLHESRTLPEQRVHMISVVMDDNIDDLERLIERCRDLGITFLLTLYSSGRGDKPKLAVPGDVSERLLALKRKHKNFVALSGYLGRFSQALRDNGVAGCRAGKNLCNIDNHGNVSLCIDRLDAPVGNILTDEMRVLEKRLLEFHDRNTCGSCWTSCRGTIETLMYGRAPHKALWDYFQMARPIPLGGAFA